MSLPLESYIMALRYHKDQKYGFLPYIKHLEDTASIVKKYYPDAIYLICAAYLHDILEDTPCTFEILEQATNRAIANIVYAVTDEQGVNRKERKLKTYPKIRGNTDATIIKLADRIANVSYCIKDKNDKLFEMYKKEYPEFKSNLQIEGSLTAMWEELDSLLTIKI
jgi:guanosine-3',5'-bis(diphosphate) 3'-pyrophosphohydrolase